MAKFYGKDERTGIEYGINRDGISRKQRKNPAGF